MPKYQVLDNTTNKKYIFEGDTPPTDQDVEDYFKSTQPSFISKIAPSVKKSVIQGVKSSLRTMIDTTYGPIVGGHILPKPGEKESLELLGKPFEYGISRPIATVLSGKVAEIPYTLDRSKPLLNQALQIGKGLTKSTFKDVYKQVGYSDEIAEPLGALADIVSQIGVLHFVLKPTNIYRTTMGIAKRGAEATTEFATDSVKFIAQQIMEGKELGEMKISWMKEFSPKVGQKQALQAWVDLNKYIKEIEGGKSVSADWSLRKLFPGVERPTIFGEQLKIEPKGAEIPIIKPSETLPVKQGEVITPKSEVLPKVEEIGANLANISDLGTFKDVGQKIYAIIPKYPADQQQVLKDMLQKKADKLVKTDPKSITNKLQSEIVTSAQKIMKPGETLEENIARTKDWISATLDNDETSTNEEMVAYFQKEGGFSKDVAEFIVSKRARVKSLPFGVKKEMKAPKEGGVVKETKLIKAKKQLAVLPHKRQLLEQIQEQIDKAPDIPVSNRTEKVKFQIDGGAEIFNTKSALTEFKSRISKTPATILAERSYGKKLSTTPKGIATFQEQYDQAVKSGNKDEVEIAHQNLEQAKGLPIPKITPKVPIIPPDEKDTFLEQGYQEGLKKEKKERQAGRVIIPINNTTTPTGKISTNKFINGIKEKISDIFSSFQFYKDAPPQLRNAIRTDLIGGLSKIKDKVYNKISVYLWGGLNETEISQSVELIFARNQLSRIKAGKGDPSITPEVAQDILNNVQKSIINRDVIASADRWNVLMDRYFDILIERGVISPESRIEDYAPIFVEDYTPDWAFYKGIPTRLRQPFRGYTKRAYGTTKAYKKDIEALLGHCLRIEYDNMIENFLIIQANKYDYLTNIPKEKQMELFGSYMSFGKYPTPKYPKPNRIYEIDGQKFRAWSPNSPFTRQLYPIEVDDKIAIALGKYAKTYLLPENIYKTFTRFSESAGYLSPYIFWVNRATGYWKSMAILSHFPSFNINNLVGDTWMVMIQHPEPLELLKEIDDALSYLTTNYKNFTPFQQELNIFILNEAVLDSAFVTTELPHIKQSSNPLQYLLQMAQNVAQFREEILRTAQASYFLKKMKAGKGDNIKQYYNWIDTQELPLNEALGKIARETLIDYQKMSKPFRQLIRGILFPFGTWYFKGSKLMWNFHRYKPLKAIFLFLLLPLIATLWNQGDKKRRELEEQLPDGIRHRTHYILGETPEGNIKVWSLQLPQDVLIGTKVYSIAVNEAFRVLNGEKSIELAAKDTLKQWGISETKGIAYLMAPMVRFIRGLVDQRDPYDNTVIYPTDIRRMSSMAINYHRGLFFIKCSVPFLSATLRDYTQKKTFKADDAVNDFIGLPALGIRDYSKKTEIALRDGRKISYDTYQRLQENMQKEAGILLSIQDDFIISGKEPQEYYKSLEMQRHLAALQSLYKDKWTPQVQKSLNDRIKNSIENDPETIEKWAFNNYNNSEGEQKIYYKNIMEEMKRKRLERKIKMLPKSAR